MVIGTKIDKKKVQMEFSPGCYIDFTPINYDIFRAFRVDPNKKQAYNNIIGVSKVKNPFLYKRKKLWFGKYNLDKKWRRWRNLVLVKKY